MRGNRLVRFVRVARFCACFASSRDKSLFNMQDTAVEVSGNDRPESIDCKHALELWFSSATHLLLLCSFSWHNAVGLLNVDDHKQR